VRQITASLTVVHPVARAGVNSYTRELGFNPLDVITARIAGGGIAGTGTAANSSTSLRASLRVTPYRAENGRRSG
jgi:hypothetical protein